MVRPIIHSTITSDLGGKAEEGLYLRLIGSCCDFGDVWAKGLSWGTICLRQLHRLRHMTKCDYLLLFHFLFLLNLLLLLDELHAFEASEDNFLEQI